MKTIKIFLFAATLLATTSAVNAQLFSAKVPAAEKSTEATISGSTANKFSSANIMVNKAGFKAVKNFTSRYKDGASVKWTNETNVITASFNDDGIYNTSVYDKKGHWIRDMKSYDEDKMPRSLRETVKRSKYFDDRITHVQEFIEDGLLFYVVHLEDDKSYKQITVYEGEIKLLSKFDKQQ
jgi:hypothetical protein